MIPYIAFYLLGCVAAFLTLRHNNAVAPPSDERVSWQWSLLSWIVVGVALSDLFVLLVRKVCNLLVDGVDGLGGPGTKISNKLNQWICYNHERPCSGTERGRENSTEGINSMSEENVNNATAPRSVDQQQACSPPSRAWKTQAEIVALELCPECGEYGVILMGGSNLGEEPSGKHKMCLKCEWHTNSSENKQISKTIRQIERHKAKIDDLQHQVATAEQALFGLCDHPLDDIVHADCFDADGDYNPPMRVCTICGLAEEGWGCGFKKLGYHEPNSRFKQVSEKTAWKMVRKYIKQK